ncbi:hypothetical protein ACJET8_002428 [Citrobacter farmeri]
MIKLTIEGHTHSLTEEDARELALALAAEVDNPGQMQHYTGNRTGGRIVSHGEETPDFPDAGITLTNC